jgi:hypothetical protein
MVLPMGQLILFGLMVHIIGDKLKIIKRRMILLYINVKIIDTMDLLKPIILMVKALL